jgi:hypothetical protein
MSMDTSGSPAVVTDAPGGAAAVGRAATADGGADPGRARPHRALPLAVALALGGFPLLVALVAMRDPGWFPVLEYAMTELRVRDVASSHPPLVGLTGRIYGHGLTGSHPGPISFWALWPVYALLGGSAWALQAATAVLNLAALGTALWIAMRRGGRGLLLGVAAALGLLLLGFGMERLTEPWNPYMPFLWWVVFLLAVWSVLDGDPALLPVAVVAGTFCAQTHVPYIGLVVGMLAFLALVLGVQVWRAEGRERRRLLGWGVSSAALLTVLWLPPVMEQRRPGTGNLSVLRESFTHPAEPTVGLGRRSLEVWLAHLDLSALPRHVTSFDRDPGGSPGAGLVLLCVWGASAVLAWRRRQDAPSIWHLHVVAAVALALGLVSVSRIFGPTLAYLLLWGWGTTALVVLAAVWSAVDASARDPSRRRPPRWAAHGGAVALVAVVLGASAGLTASAVGMTAPNPEESIVLEHLVPGTVEALRDGGAPGGGVDGRYLVQWSDAVAIGSAGYGLVLELERAGFDVGVHDRYATNVVRHRARVPADATASVTLVRGDRDIEKLRSNPDVTEVAYFEPRTRDEVARHRELSARVDRELRALGLDDLADLMHDNAMSAAVHVQRPKALADEFDELVKLTEASAVFVGPPDLGATPF